MPFNKYIHYITCLSFSLTDSFLRFICYLLFYVFESFACVYVCAMCVPGTHGGHKVSDNLELCLRMTVSHHLDPG